MLRLLSSERDHLHRKTKHSTSAMPPAHNLVKKNFPTPRAAVVHLLLSLKGKRFKIRQHLLRVLALALVFDLSQASPELWAEVFVDQHHLSVRAPDVDVALPRLLPNFFVQQDDGVQVLAFVVKTFGQGLQIFREAGHDLGLLLVNCFN